MPGARNIAQALDVSTESARFDAAIPLHLAGGEKVHAWVFGRTWPNEAVRVTSGLVLSAGALGGAVAGALTNRATDRFVVLTSRRLIGFVSDGGKLAQEWETTPATVTSVDLKRGIVGSELVLHYGNDRAEARLHVGSGFRRQAQSFETAVRAAMTA
jgi:hypothetical protein